MNVSIVTNGQFRQGVVAIVLCVSAAIVDFANADEGQQPASIYARNNLVAWCIVPFDASKRGPAERAEMVSRLGLTKVAYDWRDQHVPSFEEEIVQYQKHGIEFFAFWSWHGKLGELVRKHGIHPQIWVTAPSPDASTHEGRVVAAAQSLKPLVETTRRLGLKLGLYNHGNWGGEPVNLVAVCQHLREHERADHVGIVYNFHHGHAHIDDFADALKLMQPYLLCLNLNGMNHDENPKILPIGAGQHEQRMMQIARDSGYRGPVGIIHHREELDAEEGLRQNIEGLKGVLFSLGDAAALETFQN